MTQLVLGIGGLKGHGKDTVADIYASLGEGVVKFGMSDHLNKYAKILNPLIMIPHEEKLVDIIAELDQEDYNKNYPIYGESYEGPYEYDFLEEKSAVLLRYAALEEAIGFTAAKEYPNFRQVLTGLGTDVGRALNANMWADKANEDIAAALADGANAAIITGLRYTNELDILKNYPNTISVYVERPGYIDKGGETTHSSENTLTKEDFDVVVTNDGSLEDLRNTFLTALEHV